MKDKDDTSEPLQTEFEAIAASPAFPLRQEASAYAKASSDTSAGQVAGAGSAPGRVKVELDLDSDLLAWLKAQPTEWRREINNTMRFFMETSSPPAKPPQGPAPPARTPGR